MAAGALFSVDGTVSIEISKRRVQTGNLIVFGESTLHMRMDGFCFLFLFYYLVT